MKILFIYPDLNIDVNWRGAYYEGVASLSAILKSKGHYVEFAHIYNLTQGKNIIERVASGFDLVAFSGTTTMFPFVRYCSAIIKKQFKNLPLLCGGAHATSAPREILKNSDIDYVCIGEGEYFMLDFLEYLLGARKKNDIKNLAYKNGGGGNEILINELRPPINPLDDLPFPDREIFDSIHRESTTGAVMAGRGCPFRCAYCSNNYINEIYQNKYLRFRKPETVISEIKLLIKKYPNIEQLFFLDDVFVLKKSWLSDFCKLYKDSIGLPFIACAYPTTITDEKIRMLKESGCNEIGFGIQSGNEFVRNNVMQRHVSNNEIKESIRILKKYEVNILVDIIYGVPLEEKSHMLDTIKICGENEVKAKSHIFYPLPNTSLEKISIEKGLFDKNTYGEDYHSKTILNYTNLHKARVLFFHRYSNYLILIYRIFAYSLTNFLSKRIRLYILDKILCSDFVIFFVMNTRFVLIKLRSFLRKLKGLDEYKLTQLK